MGKNAASLVAAVLVLATAARGQEPPARLLRPIPAPEALPNAPGEEQPATTLYRGAAPDRGVPLEFVPTGAELDLPAKAEPSRSNSLWHQAPEAASLSTPPKARVSPSPAPWTSSHDLPRATVSLPRARVDLPHARVDLPHARVKDRWVAVEATPLPGPLTPGIVLVSATAPQPPPPPAPAPQRPNPLPPAALPPAPKPGPAPVLFPSLPREEANPCCFDFYGRADYLLWWTRGSQLPPLVTTGPVDGPPSVLLGNQSVSGGARSGGRLLVGAWLLEDRLFGVDVEGFFLGQSNQHFSATPQASASVSSSFWGVAADARSSLAYDTWYHIDGRLGYRTLGLDEALAVSDQTFAGFPRPDLSRAASDRFATHNQFHGARLGLDAGLVQGAWSIDLRGSVALGCTVQNADISGLTLLTANNGLTQAFPAGVLAASSSVGNHTRGVFSVVPEFGLRLGYQLTERLRAYIGYDLIYWSNVIRPDSQVEHSVNLGPPPPANPGAWKPPPGVGPFTFTSSDFWAQGLTFGLEFRY